MKRVDLRYPSDPRYVHEVRRAFQEFVRGASLSSDETEDLKIAISEACANAISHGSPRGPENQFRVALKLSSDELQIEVADEGGGFAPVKAALPDSFCPSGRGIFLMQHFCDRVRVEPRPHGSAVILEKHLRAAEAERDPSSRRRGGARHGGAMLMNHAMQTV